MQVESYMSHAPVTIRDDTDYWKASEIMQEKNLHHLPVVGSDNSVIGIVARRDLQIAATHFHEAPVEIGDVMHQPVTTISSAVNLIAAIEHLINQGIGCLPVTKEGGNELVGIITEIDMLRALRDMLAKQA